MTIEVEGPMRAAWFTTRLARLLRKARKRGVPDSLMVEMLNEILDVIRETSGETLAALNGDMEDGDDGGAAYG